MFCIDFEDADLVSDSVGVYRPWILNDGVTTVDNSMGVTCPQGQRCGFFNESVLEVAFFSNNYAQWPSLRITLDYMMIASTSIDQGIISNDCFNGADYAAGNSLYCSADSDTFNGGLRGTGVIGDVDLSAVSMSKWNVSLLVNTHTHTHTHSFLIAAVVLCFLYVLVYLLKRGRV